MGQALPKPALRPMLPADAAYLAAIYRASVMELTGDDYSEAQQAAWAETSGDPDFAEKLSKIGRAHV